MRLEELSQHRPAACDREASVGDVAVRLDARGPQGVLPTDRLLAGRQRIRVAGDEADATMPELDQVLRGDPPGGALVDADGGHLERLGRAVDEHEPRASLDQLR